MLLDFVFKGGGASLNNVLVEKVRYILVLLLLCSMQLNAQHSITGIVQSHEGDVIPFAVVVLDQSIERTTDIEGRYLFSNVKEGKHQVTVEVMGFLPETKEVEVKLKQQLAVNFTLQAEAVKMDEMIIKGKTAKEKLDESGFSVEAVEVAELQNQSIPLNRVMDRTPGVRVRQTGGMGSDYDYSIDGMSGNAIRFFVDGIPMDYFGSSYTINNLPISLIKRIEVYKGVVPVELGSDALGGAINIVTSTQTQNFLEASYSYGSFNTHQAAVQGQWIDSNSRFTTRVSTFYNYSDNNYKVWGKGVNYGDASTGFQTVEFTKENPAERFNDDFRTASTKLDVGFTEKNWADQFFISIIGSDLKRGIQTGQNMSRVYGRVRYNERFIMPSVSYQKRDLFTKGLDVNIFSGFSFTNSTLIDTSHTQYDWRGVPLGISAFGGEIDYDGGKSEFTLSDESWVGRLNASYELSEEYKIGLNYVGAGTSRTGKDPYSPAYRIPYLEPQKISSHFAGLSLESTKFDDKLYVNAFVKLYHFDAVINDFMWVTDGYEILRHENSVTNLGGGLATSYKLKPKALIKFSLEQATRLPTATEALGNGVAIENNPEIRPETSFNVNLGAIFGRYSLGGKHGVKISINTFFRDTKDMLLFTITSGFGNGEYMNVDKVLSKGVELDVAYDYDNKFKITVNGTYLDMRNNLEYEPDGRKNITYLDRLRNTPYLMANAGFEWHFQNVIQKTSKLMFYFHAGYVHEFFLNWPSLGNKDQKRIIPSQLVFDTGISYTFPSEKISLAIDVSNLFNEQVYDNYLLQKPGRAMFFKVNYHIKSKHKSYNP